MPWFRLEDGFHSHPKVILAGNEAVGLYVRCGTYAAQHLTDGFIPEHVALLYGTPELTETLVRAKLWRRTRGGWHMPDYLDFNPSREAVEKERKARAERQARWREKKRGRRVTDAATDASGDAAPYPPRPEGGGGTGSPRASGEPDDPPYPPQGGVTAPPPQPPAGARRCTRHKRRRSGCRDCDGPPVIRRDAASVADVLAHPSQGCGHGTPPGQACALCRRGIPPKEEP